MARIAHPLLLKLKRLLKESFPESTKIKLDDHNGIVGSITSSRFEGMESLDRQTLIGKVLRSHLSTDERHRVQVIVGVSPEEEVGYLASLD